MSDGCPSLLLLADPFRRSVVQYPNQNRQLAMPCSQESRFSPALGRLTFPIENGGVAV